MKWTPAMMKWGLRFYGPYVGAGIRVENIAQDWRQMRVSMGMKWFNKNIMGTHFGGSLYSMVDPHLMLMLMQILGKSYQVWDQSAQIDFLVPGKGRVYAEFKISDKDLEDILDNTSQGKKYLHQFNVQVLDKEKAVVAETKKIIYVRKKA